MIGVGLKIATLASSAILATFAGAEAQTAPHWSYEAEAGPAKWGSLEPTFQSCAVGVQQSPIDLAQPISARISLPLLNWRDETGSIVNNGHTIQVTLPGGSVLGGEDSAFKLTQFHFHTPSEHAVAGKRAEMEAHFVHTGPEGRIKVVGVLLTPGKTHAEFRKVMAAAATANAGGTAIAVNPRAFLPKKKNAFRYEGSLTTPPCSEVVDWTVYRYPVEVSADDIGKFKALFRENARPLQPTNRRFVLEATK